MKAPALLAILCLFGVTTIAQTPNGTQLPASVLNSTGFKLLGHPNGKFLVIEGTARPLKGISDPRTLVVTTVNGEKLEKPYFVKVRNVEALPQDTPIILRGYVSGEYVGIPSEVLEKEPIVNCPQVPFQFTTYFVVTSIVEPQDLQLFSRPPRQWTRPVLFNPQKAHPE